jgi:hypothetical protein
MFTVEVKVLLAKVRQIDAEQKETSFCRVRADHGGMPEGKHEDHRHDDTGPHLPHERRQPYWQRAHKDWKFWVGVVFLFAAIFIYVGTLDLSSVPRPGH